MLRAFDVTQVTGAMVHKVKQTLRLPALKPLIAALDQADEAGGGGARRDPGQRPQVGGTALFTHPNPTPKPPPHPEPLPKP